MNTKQQEANQLKRTMKSRHLFMISLGGVIGTGFFLGTGYTINEAGPLGAVLSYLTGGFIMYLTMLCLGELAVALPVSGSFQTYATKFISPAFGFAVGWIYWLGWAVTVALEFLSAGQLMLRWFPHVGVWVWCLVFGGLLFLLNALTAKAFGESEFWFSGIKILVILLFIFLGGAAMFGLIDLKGGQEAPLFSHFYEDGLFPNGIQAMLITMITVNFAFQGTELIGIAAGESENPEKTVPRSIRQTVWRTLIFFVLSVAIIAGMIPWKQAGVVESPFVVVFDQIGIPYAADMMNFVILIALLSVANSGLFASTRIMYSMANDGQAFAFLGRANKRGIPMNALLVTLLFASLSLLSSVAAKDTLYIWLLSMAGMSAQVGWITITLSQLMFRRKYIRDGGKVEDLKFKTPLYPIVPIVGLTLNTIVLISLAFDSEQRMALYCGIPFMVICVVIYHLFIKKRQQANKQLEI
ncbi:amino acid permease [Bacillus atrophaeus]|uniref:amino acid permease n=1 Tax=Bacillus atrophaeus TaxID=1452 RepID=UPI00077A43A5|nr:amino acid permease [Bacillus atrophaeus]MBT2624746.1 amino acid permease [Bacillus sp. ISL-32]KXZ19095.1 amino acid permease [Bacillus atrophaeus]MCY8489266.1 amino acid permease [Bacillus atrophaeus]MCY8498558.1 amino acid permease [Bacillus atrophaeus]MCY8811590.1 amino acid permease [Bacillus atrophaeus]